MASIYAQRFIVGRPFTIEIDVTTYDPDTDSDVVVDLTGATGVTLRLLRPPNSQAADYTAQLAGNPNNRITYTGTGTELVVSGTWRAVVIYTLSGSTRESFNEANTFTVDKASPAP